MLRMYLTNVVYGMMTWVILAAILIAAHVESTSPFVRFTVGAVAGVGGGLIGSGLVGVLQIWRRRHEHRRHVHAALGEADY